MFDVSCRVCRKTYSNLADALECAQSHEPARPSKTPQDRRKESKA